MKITGDQWFGGKRLGRWSFGHRFVLSLYLFANTFVNAMVLWDNFRV